VSRQFVEWRLAIFEDRRVETFGEPAVDRREKITGFGALTLIAPESGKAGGGAKLEKLCALPLRNDERLMVALFGRGSIAGGAQEIASYPMQLCLVAPLIGGFMICAASATQFRPSLEPTESESPAARS
jgi:hypothetical protein